MEKQVAVLIDGDNISSKYAEYIIREASQYGNIKICRLYGSINCPNVRSWYKKMPGQGIMPMLQISYADGKSIADQALTIDAMDIVYRELVDVFCIVSSDSDFTKLVYRLKETGNSVIGIGEQKTKESLAKACDEFKILDLIYKKETEDGNTPVEIECIDESTEANIAEEDMSPEIIAESEISIPTEEEVIKKIVHLLDVNFADELKTHLSKIGVLLSKEWPGFDARNYGYRNMRQLLNNHSDIVKIEDDKAPDGIHNITYIMKK